MNKACAWKNVFQEGEHNVSKLEKMRRAKSSLHLFLCMVVCLQGNQKDSAIDHFFSSHKGNVEQQTEYKVCGWATCSQLHD